MRPAQVITWQLVGGVIQVVIVMVVLVVQVDQTMYLVRVQQRKLFGVYAFEGVQSGRFYFRVASIRCTQNAHIFA
jgi:hypothetical protein